MGYIPRQLSSREMSSAYEALTYNHLAKRTKENVHTEVNWTHYQEAIAVLIKDLQEMT